MKRATQEDIVHEFVPFLVTCPSCSAATDVGKSNLRQKGAWRGLRCKKCEHIHKASKWLCTCGQPWIRCSQHFMDGLKCRTNRVPKPTKPKDSSTKLEDAKLRRKIG